MKSRVVVLLLAGIVGLAVWRDWFRLSVDNSDRQASATVTMDNDKMHEDEQKAKGKMQGFEQGAKEKTSDLTGNVKQPEWQP